MPLSSLEVLLDRTSDTAVRGLWSALDGAGLPSQAQHRGVSNAPHLTLVSAPQINAAHLGWAEELLGPLIPAAVDVSGHVVFGDGARHTLALLCAASAPLTDAVTRLSLGMGVDQERARVPHITLARRLTAAQVGRALEVLGDQRMSLRRVTLAEVRHWDPATRSVTTVVG
jgi:2'-5' RNA ligase